jgi:TolA-binding protein
MFGRSLSALSVLVALAAAVAVTVAVALTAQALFTTHDALGVIDQELTSVSQHADPLTYQIHTVNNSLNQIQSSLGPLNGQATDLNNLLAGVDQTLVAADGSVQSINSKVSPIEASLSDADARLGLGPTGEANEVGPGRATAKVVLLQGQVGQLISVLVPVQSDLSNSSGLLSTTNTHLHSVCTTGVVGLLPGGNC